MHTCSQCIFRSYGISSNQPSPHETCGVWPGKYTRAFPAAVWRRTRVFIYA